MPIVTYNILNISHCAIMKFLQDEPFDDIQPIICFKIVKQSWNSPAVYKQQTNNLLNSTVTSHIW